MAPSVSSTGLPAGTEHRLAALAAPHVQSFNYMLDHGLQTAVEDMQPRELFFEEGGKRVQFWIESASIGAPTVSDTRTDTRLLPRECRERGMTYNAPLTVRVGHAVGDEVRHVELRVGNVPIMVRSSHCHLHGLEPKALTQLHEEANEFGGYFLCNGIERVVRMIQIPRRNYPMAISRASFVKRGQLYSTKGVMIRCARADQSTVTLTLHYLLDGNATVRFSMRRQEFFLPVMLLLKALVDTSDAEIFARVLGGSQDDTYMSDRMQIILHDHATQFGHLRSREDVLAFLGERFRTVLDMPPSLSNAQAGQYLLDRYILVHLPSHADKFQLLLLMLRKLYAFVAGRCAEDNADAASNQEVLLAGHLYLMYLKEQLEVALKTVADSMVKDVRMGRAGPGGQRAENALLLPGMSHAATVADAYSFGYFRKCVARMPDLGRVMYTMLATGNLNSPSGLDLMQQSGFTVVADRINFLRFLTHFRSIHRGQFFTEMKTTAVRKLLPESWGFMCPVHTPDGGPCGLLNHLSADCTMVSHTTQNKDLPALLVSMGVQPVIATGGIISATSLPVVLDGRVVGGVDVARGAAIARQLREYKSAVLAGACAAQGITDARDMTLAGALADAGPAAQTRWADTPQGRLGAAGTPWVPPAMEVAFVPPPSHSSAYDISCEEGSGQSSLESKGDDSLMGTFPGLFLFSQPARFVRPVRQLWSGRVELVGSMEQVYMEVACTADDVTDIAGLDATRAAAASAQVSAAVGGDAAARAALRGDTPQGVMHPYTHMETSPRAMLSLAASLTPFSDMNQSPRNMYQCQMAKQTMGTPAHALATRSDTKLFRLQTPQVPLVQTEAQSAYGLDEFPNGANAIVAVIAYTGMDMEDAMIINKGSYDRGFSHASVYKTHIVDLAEKKGAPGQYVFNNIAKGRGRGGVGAAGGPPLVESRLDADGLPPVGTQLKQGDPVYVVADTVDGSHRVSKHKDAEPAVVESVRVLGATKANKAEEAAGGITRVALRLRYNRNPVVGDKFSSRHGQKGTLSLLWPQEDMPFSESGMTPDIIINPHAFPSRMTIGMLVESMAGKAGAMHGRWQDSTPFAFNERQRAVDYFGEQLEGCGYSYYGSEPMYSGVAGTELHVHIYVGVVYYQRLRHMVSDKYQVRSMGPINNLTRQPLKGRKKKGGIRFGEMERDSLLAHGVSYLLHDRLMNCSDRHVATVCTNCGSILSPVAVPREIEQSGFDPDAALAASEASAAAQTALMPATAAVQKLRQEAARQVERGMKYWCLSCDTGRYCTNMPLPYVFRYLANELSGMGVRLTLDVQDEVAATGRVAGGAM